MMTECESKKTVVSLKGAIWDGFILDLFLLFLANIIIGSIIGIIMLFIVIAHWIFNAAVLVSPKARNSRAGKDFIRFGIFPLMLVTFVMRYILIILGVDFLV